MKAIAKIEGESIVQLTDGTVTFTAKAAIDVDGSGNPHGDPAFQADTSLHQGSKALNADIDRYIVVPPIIIKSVKETVLGCQAYALNLQNGRSSEAVVGDIGPHKKLGEISRALAIALGIDPSPTSGGTTTHSIFYALYPGKRAIVNQKRYTLQPS